MLEKYRKDYDGEYVLVRTRFRNGAKEQDREWIANPIVNQHISDRAAVIGSDTDDVLFDFRILENHRGGLMGSKKLQTYGSGKVWKDMRLQFMATVDPENIKQIQESNYQEGTIVYTQTSIVLANPGKFYVVPFFEVMDELAIAVYLAAFDGHKEIFLLGYNKDTPSTMSNWTTAVNSVFKTYASTSFYLIGAESSMPQPWLRNSNVKTMTHRQFVSYCDV